jgi:hypothetical protein
MRIFLCFIFQSVLFSCQLLYKFPNQFPTSESPKTFHIKLTKSDAITHTRDTYKKSRRRSLRKLKKKSLIENILDEVQMLN